MEVARCYPAIGGVAGWRIPMLAALLTLGTLLNGEWGVAVCLALVGLVGRTLDRAVIFDVSPAGLARGVMLGGRFLTPARVLAWRSIDEITTRWRHERDFTALDTVVTSRDASRVAFSSSRMGFAAYRALLGEVARRAPHARRSGLTDEILAEAATPRRWQLNSRVIAALSGLGVLAVVAVAAWL